MCKWTEREVGRYILTKKKKGIGNDCGRETLCVFVRLLISLF